MNNSEEKFQNNLNNIIIMDQPSTSKSCINFNFNNLNKSIGVGDNASQKNLTFLVTTNNTPLLIKEINIDHHHNRNNTNNTNNNNNNNNNIHHMNTTMKSLLTFNVDDDDDEDNEYNNNRIPSSGILNEGSEDHFLSSAAIHNYDDYDPDNSDVNNDDNRSYRNDDEFDLNKIKKDALNLTDDTTNFDIVNNLNTSCSIYEYKRENSIDLGCDFVDNEFLVDKVHENILTETKPSCKYLEMVYDEADKTCNNSNNNNISNNNNNGNNNNNNHNNNNSTENKSNQNIIQKNESDDEMNTYDDNIDDSSSTVSSILREHNYINLSQILLPPENPSRSSSTEVKKLCNSNDDLKLHLEKIQKFLNNNNNNDINDNSNNKGSGNGKNDDNSIIDKDTLELTQTILQQILSISKTNDKLKNNTNKNDGDDKEGSSENNLRRNNLALLLEACEIQNSANASAEKTTPTATKVPHSKSSQTSEKLKTEIPSNHKNHKIGEKLGKIKIKSEIKLESKSDQNDTESVLADSFPSIPDFDIFDNYEGNNLEQEGNTNQQNTLKLQSQQKNRENGVRSSTEKQSTESENLDTESLLFTENRSEPLEYEEHIIMTDNDHTEKLLSSQDSADCRTSGVVNKNERNDENFQNLKAFAKDFYESCEKLCEDCEDNSKMKGSNKDNEKKDKLNEFLMKKYYEFKNFVHRLNIEKNDYFSSIEIQTDIIGGEIFKKRKRKLNEEMKNMLLSTLSSSSDSDEDNDDENERENYHKSKHDKNGDDMNAFERNYNGESDDRETNLLDESEPPYLIGGMDLSKCIEESVATDANDIESNNLEKINEENKFYDDTIMNEDDDDVFQNIIECDVEVKSDDGYYEVEQNIEKNNFCENFIKIKTETKTKTTVNILEDEKLKMKPVVIIKALTENDKEKYLDELRDKEIDRLVNFENLMNPKISHGSYTKKRKDEKRRKKVRESFDMLDGFEKSSTSEDSSSEEEDKIMTEKEYLEKCNNNLKQQFLHSTSSSDYDDDENDDNMSDIENLKKNGEDKNSLTDESDDYESELPVDKFLKKLAKKSDKEIDDDDDDDDGDDDDDDEEMLISKSLESSLSDDEIQENKLKNDDKDADDLENNKKTEEKQANKCELDKDNKSANEENNETNLKERKTSSDSISTLNDDEKIKKTKPRFRDRIYDSTRKVLTEKEFNLESLDSDKTAESEEGKNDNDDDENNEGNEESSDCEILNDDERKRMKRRKPKPKSVETLVAEADRRKQNASNNKNAEDLISLSSSSETEIEGIPVEEESEERKRVTKPMLRQDQLAGETRTAQKHENERIRRLEQKQKMMKKAFEKHNIKNDGISENELILDYNPDTDTFIKVHPDIVKHMKPHQFDGVKFMYDNCYGSVKDLKTHPGSGCILAHCMGLGKTFQLVALLHTVVSYKELNTSKVLILCPKSTVMNWRDEIKNWLHFKKNSIHVIYFPDTSDLHTKLKLLKEWSECGSSTNKKPGILLIGYEAFRTLISYRCNKNKRNHLTEKEKEILKQKIKKFLIEPGADLVICDEGHIIKNRKAAISTAVAEIKTLRRIILTGTPIQNNLKEYYSMVNFIKPSFLGTEREFSNLYANPIKNGQHKDSNDNDIKIMKQRSFVLHKKLTKFVQRKEAALLQSFLPEKFEYVLFIPMTEVQNRLYEYFLESTSKRQSAKGKSLIPDYTCLRKVWTHPKVLEIAWKNAIEKQRKEQQQQQQQNPSSKVSTPTLNSDDDLPDDINDIQTGELSVSNDWWRPLITKEDLESLLPSNKLIVMFEILRMCEENKEKCLIFSAFVAVLNVVEYFMDQIDKRNHSFLNNSGFERFKGPWKKNKNFFRLDGKTPKSIRHQLITEFNDPKNTTTKCFLISAKAGGQGINLIGANRVIILDTSWNPSNDQQNIFRIYRLGQQKKCYIYRLLSMGTMEEKVYSRSVTKQAMSFRVVDEQQIDRHYSMAELTELYILTKPDYSERPVPALPQDVILANLLRNYPNLVYKYHEHDTLLENKSEQELSEKEKTEAWLQYERDLQRSQEPPAGPFDNQNMAYNAMRTGYNQAGYPMPYGFGSLPLSNFNYGPGNPMFNLYSMYQNFPDYPALMSRLSHPNTSSLGAFPSPYLTNFMQSPPGSLSTANLLSSNTNGMSLTGLDSYAAMNTSPQPQRAHYNSTSHINPASIGLYSPPPQPVPTGISAAAASAQNDSFIADLRKFFESSPNASILGPFDSTSAMNSRNQYQQQMNVSSINSPLSKLQPSSSVSSSLLHSSPSASAIATAFLGSSSSTGRNSSIDSIQTSVIRNPDVTPPLSGINLSNQKLNTILQNNEARGYSTSGGSIQLSKSPQDISITNSRSSSLLSNLNDPGKSIRPNSMGIAFPENLSSILGTSNSTLSSPSLSTAATQKKSTNLSIHAVNSTNEKNNKSLPSPVQSSSNNVSSFPSANVKTAHQFSKPSKCSESPVIRPSTPKIKSVSDARSKTPISTPKSPVNQQQMKNILNQNASASNSGAISVVKTGGNKTTTQTSLVNSSLPAISLQPIASSGNKNSPSSPSLVNAKTATATSQSMSPSLATSNRSNLNSTSGKIKTVNASPKTYLNSNQKVESQNKPASTTPVITPSLSFTAVNTPVTRQQTINLSEMLKMAVSDKSYQQQASTTQNNKNNVRSSISASPASPSIINNKQTAQISNMKNQSVNPTQQKLPVNNKRTINGPSSPHVNKSKFQNSTKTATATVTGSNANQNSNKIISSKDNTVANANNSNSPPNQTITTNKNTLSPLNNRSNLSIRPIDNGNKSTKTGVGLTSLSPTSGVQKRINPAAFVDNSTGKAIITTPIITQVKSLNMSANKNVLSKTTVSDVSRKRPGQTLTSISSEDIPISLRQIKKPKNLPIKSSNIKHNVPDSFPRIQSAQSLAALPNPKSLLSKTQSSQLQKVVNEGTSMWQASRGSRN